MNAVKFVNGNPSTSHGSKIIAQIGNLSQLQLSLDQKSESPDRRQQTIHKYLIERSQQGDRKAQNELFKLYVDAMYNICRRIIGDPEEAKDALQDAFTDAFLKLGTLKDASLFSAWLKRIVINKCLNEVKKKRELEYLDETAELPEPERDDRSDDIKFEAKKILAAMNQISEGCRIVMNLYLFEGYDHKEIGEILSISESASKAQYSKGKAKIRKLLGN